MPYAIAPLRCIAGYMRVSLLSWLICRERFLFEVHDDGSGSAVAAALQQVDELHYFGSSASRTDDSSLTSKALDDRHNAFLTAELLQAQVFES